MSNFCFLLRNCAYVTLSKQVGKTPKQITERLASSRDEDKDGLEACFTSVHENGVEKVDQICHRLAQLSGALTERSQQFQDAQSLAIYTHGSPT